MNKALLPLQSGEQPFRGKEVDPTKFLRLGVISRVDYESGYVDIKWLEGTGSTQLVQIPLSHASLRSSIRAMPEEGSVVICGWTRQTQTLETPVILGFVDPNLANLLQYRLLRNNKTKDTLQEIKSIREKIGYNVIRGKRRKIYSGEIQLESTQGAELNLDEDVYLSDSKLNEIEIKSADKSIRLSSNQLYISSQASRINNGMIAREPINNNFAFRPTVLPNGQKIQFVTDSSNPYHLGGRPFNEIRTELYETSDGILRANEVNSNFEVEQKSPYITYVLGTLVGNDKSDSAKYAKILRPQIFGTQGASEVSLDYLECNPEEYSTLASTLHFKHFSRTRFDIDKEGHLFTYLAASSGRHPLGSGRSWEGGFEGSIKFSVGAENVNNHSIILDTKGGIRSTIGYDKDFKSSYIIYQKGIHKEIMGPANDGLAYFLKARGNYKTTVDGNYDLEISGNYNVIVRGKIKIQTLAVSEESFVNDKNNIYGGAYKKIVVKDKQEQIGYDRKTKITGNLERAGGIFTPALITEVSDKYELTTGSREETYYLGSLNRKFPVKGSMTATLTAGDIKEKIILGNRYLIITTGDNQTAITTGNDIEKVTTGNIEKKITKGDFKRELTTKNSTGMVDKIVTGTHSISVKSGDILREVTNKSSVGIKDQIKNGDHIVDITKGNKIVNIKTGNSTESIVSGSKKIQVKKGDFQVAITTGKIDISTKTGKVSIKSSSQTVDISGQMKVTVKSGVKLCLYGPQVEIGQTPTRGGIITGVPGAFTHLDYFAGSPLIGSKTVKASI